MNVLQQYEGTNHEEETTLETLDPTQGQSEGKSLVEDAQP